MVAFTGTGQDREVLLFSSEARHVWAEESADPLFFFRGAQTHVQARCLGFQLRGDLATAGAPALISRVLQRIALVRSLPSGTALRVARCNFYVVGVPPVLDDSLGAEPEPCFSRAGWESIDPCNA